MYNNGDNNDNNNNESDKNWEICLFLNLIKMIKRTEIFLENLKSAEIL